MNINATVIVQAINFFIVYVLLRFFLFKPAVAMLDSENSEEETLLGMINQQKKSIEIQEKERQRYWYACREYFKMHRPSCLLYDSIGCQTSSVVDDSYMGLVSDDEIAQLAADVYKNFEEKIKNVH